MWVNNYPLHHHSVIQYVASMNSEQEAVLGLVQNVLKMDAFLSCYVMSASATPCYISLGLQKSKTIASLDFQILNCNQSIKTWLHFQHAKELMENVIVSAGMCVSCWARPLPWICVLWGCGDPAPWFAACSVSLLAERAWRPWGRVHSCVEN